MRPEQASHRSPQAVRGSQGSDLTNSKTTMAVTNGGDQVLLAGCRQPAERESEREYEGCGVRKPAIIAASTRKEK